MKSRFFRVAIFCFIPVGFLVTGIVRRESGLQGKSVSVWFAEMKMARESPGLDALRKAGLSAVSVLKRELGSESTSQRYKAAWALGQLGPIAREAAPDLIKAIDDGDPVVRKNAIEALTQLKVAEISMVPKLLNRLKDSDMGVDIASAELLKRIEERGTKEDSSVRSNQFDFAVAFAASSCPSVRLIGAERLADLSLKEDRVIRALEMLLVDQSEFVRNRTASLMAEKGIR